MAGRAVVLALREGMAAAAAEDQHLGRASDGTGDLGHGGVGQAFEGSRQVLLGLLEVRRHVREEQETGSPLFHASSSGAALPRSFHNRRGG